MKDEEFLIKELELIQNCINRIANNSFLLKGWTISLISIITSLNTKNIAQLYVFIPILFFWYLDAYFLRVERQYREMYQWCLKNHRENNSDNLFDLNPNRFNRPHIYRAIFSKTLLPFYGSLMSVSIMFYLAR